MESQNIYKKNFTAFSFFYIKSATFKYNKYYF